MSAPVLVLLALLSAGASLEADHPGANVQRSPGGAVSAVSGLAVPVGAGVDPPTAAEQFVRRYSTEFGVTDEQLVPSGPPIAGRVRLARMVKGIVVENADVIVAFDADGNIALVTLGQLPAPVSGRFALGVKQARARAQAAIKAAGKITATEPARVWYPAGKVTRPAWRVDVATKGPQGSWRVWVDAQSGRVLFKQDLRVTGLR